MGLIFLVTRPHSESPHHITDTPLTPNMKDFGRSVAGGGLVAKSGLTFVTPQTVACQAPLSIEFSS